MGQSSSLANNLKVGALDATDLRQYPARLSFEPLLRYWQKQLESGTAQRRLLAKEVLTQAKKLPALWEPIEDTSWLAQHHDLLDLMLTPIFPTASEDTVFGKAYAPCSDNAFYQTPDWKPEFDTASSLVEGDAVLPFRHFDLYLCAAIVRACHNKPLRFDLPAPPALVVEDKMGIERYYRPEVNMDFVEVKAVGSKPSISKNGVEQLLKNIYDLESLFKQLPPHKFEIQGFITTLYEEVTVETALSLLNSLLLRKDAFKTKENIAQLEKLLSSFLSMPRLRVGVLPLNNDEMDGACTIGEPALGILNLRKGANISLDVNAHYGKAWYYGDTVISEQVEAGGALAKQGIHSHLVAPLKNSNGKVIGLVELGADEPFAITSFTEIQFHKVLPQLSRCMEQQHEEQQNRIEAIMRQKFTAMHPSVEWRFVEVTERYLSKMESKGRAVMEPIQFKDIYPLYAQSDIVSSSLIRNRTIREDIKAQLEILQHLLQQLARRLEFPLLQHLLGKVDSYLEGLQDEMQSSDEPFFMNFILNDIHPVLREFAERDASIGKSVQRYFNKLDPTLEIVYMRRKAYEESVNLINDALSECVDAAEEQAQRMTPHFFEKYQTDGLQFELYAGESLLRRGKFSEFQLNNLRLWQLKTMCEVTRRMRELQEVMPMPLETAQLVFVYGQPISIKFRMDEKFFDVDGAYNLRYEIIKKRIDKACVLDTGERLTQPGKIAIVYATEPMRKLYLEFCDYLIVQDLVEPEIEELELEKLQETQGLKALRVTVK